MLHIHIIFNVEYIPQLTRSSSSSWPVALVPQLTRSSSTSNKYANLRTQLLQDRKRSFFQIFPSENVSGYPPPIVPQRCFLPAVNSSKLLTWFTFQSDEQDDATCFGYELLHEGKIRDFLRLKFVRKSQSHRAWALLSHFFSLYKWHQTPPLTSAISSYSHESVDIS